MENLKIKNDYYFNHPDNPQKNFTFTKYKKDTY